MEKLTVDAATGAKLAAVQHGITLCDPAGRILGSFQPAEPSEQWDYYVPPFTEEELREAENEPGGRTLTDILADLERRR